MIFAAPWYVHPVIAPQDWQRMLRGESGLDAVVININDGPGDHLDSDYCQVLRNVGTTTPRLIGYIDVNYGQRSAAEILADAQTWLRLYGIGSFMLDQTPQASIGSVSADLVQQLRALAGGWVLANAGCEVEPELLSHFDAVCTAELPWDEYKLIGSDPCITMAKQLLDAETSQSASKIWHLIYQCPVENFQQVVQQAADTGVGMVWVTDRSSPNPWYGLPSSYEPQYGLQVL